MGGGGGYVITCRLLLARPGAEEAPGLRDSDEDRAFLVMSEPHSGDALESMVEGGAVRDRESEDELEAWDRMVANSMARPDSPSVARVPLGDGNGVDK